jgi:hypothetical protein
VYPTLVRLDYAMPAENTPLIRSSNKKYPASLSLTWRLSHWVNYIIGGVTFAYGSYQYFPGVSNYELGGWLFTIGSTGFAIADSLEWWTNNRVGCFHYEIFEESYESIATSNFAPKGTLIGTLQRAENGVNFFFSLFGSTLYLIGSIMFIPELDEIVSGTIVFIVGSLFIFFSQSWKLWRVIRVEGLSFNLSNLLEDLPGTFVDLFAGLGGFAYFVGSVIFLPQYDTSDSETYIAALWFQLGGLLFLLSGIALAVRYFATENYPH